MSAHLRVPLIGSSIAFISSNLDDCKIQQKQLTCVRPLASSVLRSCLISSQSRAPKASSEKVELNFLIFNEKRGFPLLTRAHLAKVGPFLVQEGGGVVASEGFGEWIELRTLED